MKKEALKAYIMKYNGYATSKDIHVKPTKGVNSGSHGNLYEYLIKLALKNYRFNGIAPAGKTDTRKKINGKLEDFEIKHGCGELVSWDLFTEQVKSDIRKNKYIVYCPEYTPIVTSNCDLAILNAVKQSYIMETELFWQETCKAGLIRTKKSNGWYKDTNFSNLPFDRLTIDNLNQSQRKMSAMYDILETSAIPFETWLKDNGIWE